MPEISLPVRKSDSTWKHYSDCATRHTDGCVLFSQNGLDSRVLRRRAAVVRRVQAADSVLVQQQPVQRCVNRLACVSTDRSVVPNIPAVVFCFLNTDLIRAFYAGALPSFATCIALTSFLCYNNQFTGAYSRVSTDRSVEVSYPTYRRLRSVFSKLTCVFVVEFVSFA